MAHRKNVFEVLQCFLEKPSSPIDENVNNSAIQQKPPNTGKTIDIALKRSSARSGLDTATEPPGKVVKSLPPPDPPLPPALKASNCVPKVIHNDIITPDMDIPMHNSEPLASVVFLHRLLDKMELSGSTLLSTMKEKIHSLVEMTQRDTQARVHTHCWYHTQLSSLQFDLTIVMFQFSSNALAYLRCLKNALIHLPLSVKVKSAVEEHLAVMTSHTQEALRQHGVLLASKVCEEFLQNPNLAFASCRIQTTAHSIDELICLTLTTLRSFRNDLLLKSSTCFSQE